MLFLRIFDPKEETYPMGCEDMRKSGGLSQCEAGEPVKANRRRIKDENALKSAKRFRKRFIEIGSRFFFLFLLLVFCFWTPPAYKRLTHAFRPQKCQIDLPFTPEWETTLSSTQEKEIKAILQQPFSYLAKGQQSYVFVSSDQKYVLKLFRFDTCKMPFGQKLFHRYQKWRNPHVRTELPPLDKARKTFGSCKLAFDRVPDLTALVYIQLNLKKNFPSLQLKDRLGQTHRIDPNKYRFVLQKKCDPFLKTLREAENSERLTSSFLNLLDRFEEAGLACYDPVLGRNFAFLNQQSIAIDIGNFYYHPEKAQETKENFKARFAKIIRP